MRYLIDGYNLMHALGMAPKPGGLSLERSRIRFIEWLAVELGANVGQVSMIFDAVRSTGGNEQVHRGLYFRFADARTADDLIEELIASERTPQSLTLVSNDNRLKGAAIRRGCVSWTCENFVDWLQAGTSQPTRSASKPADEKPSPPSNAEMEEWLQRFQR